MDTIAELESNQQALRLDETPSRAMPDENEIEAVDELGSGLASYKDDNNELNLTGKAKLTAPDNQADLQSNVEYGPQNISVR